jgi:hypothetical protein
MKNHIIQDIKDVGSISNYSTRTGEGMHQDMRLAYAATNGKNVEHQVGQ